MTLSPLDQRPAYLPLTFYQLLLLSRPDALVQTAEDSPRDSLPLDLLHRRRSSGRVSVELPSDDGGASSLGGIWIRKSLSLSLSHCFSNFFQKTLENAAPPGAQDKILSSGTWQKKQTKR